MQLNVLMSKKKITHLDSRRVKKLETKGHYFSLLEEFETLRAKLVYGMTLDTKEAHRLVTLVKYFLKNAHSESFRIHVQFIHDKYIKDFKL